jgi:hypothetical protein
VSECDEVRLDLPGYLRRELPAERMARVESHLSACAGCARVVREIDEVAGLAATAPVEHAPPPELEGRVLAVIRDATTREGEGARSASRVGARVASSLAGRWPRVAVVVAPALALLLVAAGATSLALRARTAELEQRVDRLQERLAGPGETLDSVNFSGRLQRGGWAVGEVVRQDDHDYQIVVRGEGLSPTPPGHHFELWLSGNDGWASVGTFRVRSRDRVVLQFPVGVDVGNFTKLWVTLEPCDGNPDRTENDIMEASLHV